MERAEFDHFNDELRTMQELMDREDIALKDEDLEAPIDSLNLKKAVVVETGASVKKCIEKLLARHFGSLLVVKENVLVGIFTERDVLMKIAGKNINLTQAKIDDFMTPHPASKKKTDSVLSALKLMNDGGYRHIAIVDDENHPYAVLSIKNIVNYLIEFFPQGILNLPPHPIRIGTKNREGG
ncbi:MAG: cyclic nucleotide-binding/CBS domain-containing protein [bacterium]